MKLLKHVAIVIVILLLLIIAVKQQLDLNVAQDRADELQKQLDAIEYENEKKQNELDLPFEEQMKKQAQERGYKDPDAQYYYNDYAG